MKLRCCSATAPVAKYTLRAFIPRLLLISFVLGTPLYAQEPQSQEPMTWREAWRGLDEAIRLYDEEEFEDAGKLFRYLRENAPEGEFDIDVLRLLEGTSFWKAENPSEARKSLEDFEGLDEIKLRLQKRIVAGDANLSLAEKAYVEANESNDPQRTKEAKDLVTDAEQAFKSALSIDPGDDYSLTKFEKTLGLLKKIEELEEKQKQQSQENQEDQEKQENQDQEDQKQDPQEDQESQENQEPSDQTDQPDQPDESDQTNQTDQPDQPDSSDRPDQSEKQEPTEGPSEEIPEDYSEEQAQKLLDTYDEQERRQRRQFLQQQARPIPVQKDW